MMTNVVKATPKKTTKGVNGEEMKLPSSNLNDIGDIHEKRRITGIGVASS